MKDNARYVGQLTGFNRCSETGTASLEISVCPEEIADAYGKEDLVDLRVIGQTRRYSMDYVETDEGFTLKPDDDLDDCLNTDEEHSNRTGLDDEVRRKIQTVEIVEGILEMLNRAGLLGIYVSGPVN